MAKAFYHRGLTIEFDAHIPRLTVDGQPIPPPRAAGESDLSRPRHFHRCTHLTREQYVNASGDFAARDSIRDAHVGMLRSGTDCWNEWRGQNPAVRPLLYGADLSGINLTGPLGVNLANANLIGSDLTHSTLIQANFHEANLGGANLTGAKVARANFCRTDLYEATLAHADLEGANLQCTHMAKTDFYRRVPHQLSDLGPFGMGPQSGRQHHSEGPHCPRSVPMELQELIPDYFIPFVPSSRRVTALFDVQGFLPILVGSKGARIFLDP